MTSDDTINKYLRDTLKAIIDDSNYMVNKADQNAPRPKTPYCTVKIMASRSQSLEEYSKEVIDETSYKLITKAQRNILVSFNFFKSLNEEHDPFYVASLCRQALRRTSITSMLNDYGLGLAERSQIKNLTFQLDNGYEERANFTATFNFVDVDEEVVSTIDKVDISGEYEYVGTVTPIEITIENNNE